MTIKPTNFILNPSCFHKNDSEKKNFRYDYNDSQFLTKLVSYEDVEEEDPKKNKKNLAIYEPTGLAKEDFDFIKKISADDIELQKRLFLGGVMKVKREKGGGLGEIFGEGFWDKEIPRYKQSVVVGSEELHVLVVSREAYDLVMEEIIKHSETKVEFFQGLFPTYDDREVKRFAYHFSEKEFKKGEVIYSQNDVAQDVYVVKNGDVRLFREVSITGEDRERAISKGYVFFGKDSNRIGIPVISVMNNQFFGEEVFIKQDIRQHTAISSLTSFIYFLEPRGYARVKTLYADLLQVLGEQGKEKFQWRKERVLEIIDRCNAAENKELSPTQQQIASLDRKSKLKYQVGIRWGSRETLSKLKPINHHHHSTSFSQQQVDQTQNQSIIKNAINNNNYNNSLPKAKSHTALFNNIAQNVSEFWPAKDLEHFHYSKQSKKLNKVIDIRYLQRQVQVEFDHSFVPDRHDPTKKSLYVDFNVGRELSSTYRLPVLRKPSKSPKKGAQTERYVNVSLRSMDSSMLYQHLTKSQRTQEDISPRLTSVNKLNRSTLGNLTEENAETIVKEAANRASQRPAAVFGAIRDDLINTELPLVINRSSSVPKLRGVSDGGIKTRVVQTGNRGPSVGRFNPRGHSDVINLIQRQRGAVVGTKIELTRTDNFLTTGV